MTRIADYKEWNNDDGLRITFGTGEAQLGRAGTYSDEAGTQHLMEIVVVGTDLTAFGATDPTTILDFHALVTNQAFLERAEFQVTTNFTSGGAATLSLGMVLASDKATPYTDLDSDGVDAAIALTALQVNDTMPIVCDGALISTQLADNAGGYLVSAEAGTADFTAGIGILRLWFRTLPVSAKV